MNFIKKFILVTVITLIFFELSVKIFYTQDLQGTFFEQIDRGLVVNKKNYIHKIHRFKNITTKYKFGEFHNRITINNIDNKKDKILVLGDSWTLGYLLEDKNTFVHKLQNKFNEFYFVNSGTGGMGVARYTTFCDLFCKKIKPKYVIVFLNSGDVGRALSTNLFTLEDNELKKGSDKIYIKDQTKFDKIPFYKFLKNNSHSFRFLRNTVYDLIYPVKLNNENSMKDLSIDGCYYPQHSFDKEKRELAIKKSKLLFIHLNQTLKNINSKLIVINIGWYDYKLMRNENPSKEFFKEASSFFNKNKIIYFDNTPMMVEVHKNLCKFIIPIDAHPNNFGAEKIFVSSFKHLKEFF